MLQTSEAQADAPRRDEEIILGESDVLVSATCSRGTITFANETFSKASGIPIDKLIGAPHKIVRHSDMPRGIFFLMWQRLKADQRCCLYVKNRGADGCHYWVFAMVSKNSDGYLSVRIKPQASHRGEAEEIYKTLRMEEAKGMKPEASAARFAEILKEKGHQNVDGYMAELLQAELQQRSDIPALARDTLQKISETAALIHDCRDCAESVSKVFNQVRSEPVNMRILSSRIEGAGEAIGTISKNYEVMTFEMEQLLERLYAEDDGVLAELGRLVEVGMKSFESAALMELAFVAGKSDNVSDDLCDGFHETINRLQNNSLANLNEIATQAQSIPETVRQLRRRISGLDLVKLLCRVESGRSGNADTGLVGIINRLEVAHVEADQELSRLSKLAGQIKTKAMSFAY